MKQIALGGKMVPMALTVFGFAGQAATNTTLYHINPLSYPAAPVNMDLGDIAGDLFFDISQVLNVFACYDKPAVPYIICDNKETVGKDLGVTKVVLAVSEQSYGPYATCNICINGTSPLNASHSCTDGEYVCDRCDRTFTHPGAFTNHRRSCVGRDFNSTDLDFGSSTLAQHGVVAGLAAGAQLARRDASAAGRALRCAAAVGE